MSKDLAINRTYLISSNGILNVGELKDFVCNLVEIHKGDSSPEEVADFIETNLVTAVEIPINIFKKGVVVNRKVKYAPFCLLKNYTRKPSTYCIVNPLLSAEIIGDFWENEGPINA